MEKSEIHNDEETQMNGRKPRTKFSQMALKKLVGKIDKNAMVTSLSMGSMLFKQKYSSTDKKSDINNPKSMMDLSSKTGTKLGVVEEEEGIEKFLADDSDSSEDDIFDEEADTAFKKSLGNAGKDVIAELYNGDSEMTRILKYCISFNAPSFDEIMDKGIEFGELTRHKTLIFDMDETLVHAMITTKDKAASIPQGDFEVGLKSDPDLVVSVKMRPYMDLCLENLSQFYEIVVFTAGEQEYADAILDKIDDGGFIKHRLYRQHCIKCQDMFYVKDLRVILDRDEKDIILVDNSIISFAFQFDNGIPIQAYYRDMGEDDQELLYLITYLNELHPQADMREANKKKFKLAELASKLKL